MAKDLTKERVDDYFINRFTMAILPGENKFCSEILEYEQEILVEKRPMEVIDQSCRYFGSSYSGRKTGSKDIANITHKPPVVIDPANSIYFFPTAASTKANCAWIAHSFVKEYKATKEHDTEITFTNGKQITVPMSVGSFENQLFRTAQLRAVISSRIEQEQRKINMLLLPKDEKEINAFYEQIIRKMNRF